MAKAQRNGLRTLCLALVLGSVAMSACSSSDTKTADTAVSTGKATGNINYWLWDPNQKPAFEKCAAAFKTENPEATVTISQYSWGDYWSGLTNGFVAGTAPDVFTNHLANYPDFVNQGQLAPLDEQLQADGVKTDIYQKGLADLWIGKDGKRYGLPKDFDTVALFYNTKLVEDAGVTAEQLQGLKWNPADGGTYEKMIAHLTVDSNGRRGDEPGFDKTKVKVYGLGLDGGSGGGQGQVHWSMYSATTGWTVTDKNPWGTHFNYDKPEFQDTIAWMRSLIEKGYMPTIESILGQSSADIYGSGKFAMMAGGSWSINQMTGYKGVTTGIAATPTGPNGKRASMYNGLADSVWNGSKNKASAIKWVEFMGSPKCQDFVGESGIVFPAIPSSTEKARAAFKAKGVDVSNFLIHVEENTTFLFPITDHAAEAANIMQPAVDAVMTGKAEPSTLTDANNQVNQLFGS